MYQELLTKLDGPNERVGFILPGDQIIEVENVSPDPTIAFIVSDADIEKYIDVAIATWHTHPTTDSLLSGDDYLAFKSWHHVDHYIAGTDGVSGYRVEGRAVVRFL